MKRKFLPHRLPAPGEGAGVPVTTWPDSKQVQQEVGGVEKEFRRPLPGHRVYFVMLFISWHVASERVGLPNKFPVIRVVPIKDLIQ